MAQVAAAVLLRVRVEPTLTGARRLPWVLVQLDGADTSLLHVLDAPREEIRTGMRVRIRWADETVGFINDIACFEPA